MTSSHLPLSRSAVDQIAAALDTAYGCLSLVQLDRKPIDLAECMAEVGAARDLAWKALEEEAAGA